MCGMCHRMPRHVCRIDPYRAAALLLPPVGYLPPPLPPAEYFACRVTSASSTACWVSAATAAAC